jgi:hypothetical protein
MINAPSTARIRTKKIAAFLHDNIALLSSAGLHLHASTSQNHVC